MPTSSTFGTGPVATLVAELADLVKLAKVAARMQLEKAAPPGWTMPDEGAIFPRLKDEKEFRRAAKIIADMPERFGREAEDLAARVRGMTADLDAYAVGGDMTADDLRARAREMGVPWRCAQFTVHRREIEVRLRMLHALIAELYCSLEQIYTNVELVYVCPPHPCDDPAIQADDLRLSPAFDAARAFRSESAAEEEE